MSRTEIQVNARWKVARFDDLNWRVFEYREVRKQNNGRASREGEYDWMPCDAWFGHLEYAIEWIYERETADMGVHRDLKSAIRQMKSIKEQLADDVRKAVA